MCVVARAHQEALGIMNLAAPFLMKSVVWLIRLCIIFSEICTNESVKPKLYIFIIFFYGIKTLIGLTIQILVL